MLKHNLSLSFIKPNKKFDDKLSLFKECCKTPTIGKQGMVSTVDNRMDFPLQLKILSNRTNIKSFLSIDTEKSLTKLFLPQKKSILKSERAARHMLELISRYNSTL